MPDPMPPPIDTTMMIVKALGGLAGSIISVSVLQPETRRETLARAVTGTLAAVLFARPFVDLIGWDDRGVQYLLTASGGIAFLSWFLFGVIARSAAKWQSIGDAVDDINKLRGKSDD